MRRILIGVGFAILASGVLGVAYLSRSAPPRFVRISFRAETFRHAGDDRFTMIVQKEHGVKKRVYNWHSAKYGNYDRIETTEIWMLQWQGDSLHRLSRAERICSLGESRNWHDTVPILDTGPPAVILEEVDFISGESTLEMWQRNPEGFQAVAKRTVEYLLTFSRDGTKFVARNGNRVMAGNTRGLTDRVSGDGTTPLDSLLAKEGGASENTRITNDGRFVLLWKTDHAKRQVLRIQGVDLEKNVCFSLDLAPEAKLSALVDVDSINGQLLLVIEYERPEEDGNRTYAHEIIDSDGKRIRDFTVKRSLIGIATRNRPWDSARSRFLVAVNHYQVPRGTIDFILENGKTSRVFPALPQELSSTSEGAKPR